MRVNVTTRARGEFRRALLLGVCLAMLMSGALVLTHSAPAHAGFTTFCTNFNAGPIGGGSARCHEPTFRLVTNVFVESGAHSACASALNGSGSLVGGLVCTAGPHELAGNFNYTGSANLQGLISNNASGENVISGSEHFN
jgi:hypothetical protein